MTSILIIEDEPTIRESIIDILEWGGYPYWQASNGREGVAMAIANLPDLIICDVMMPEMDGYGVLFELQQHVKTQKIPFIFLTAKADRTDIRKGMGMGADDYLTKPFTHDELLEAISTRINKYNLLYQESVQHVQDVKDYLNLRLPHELRTPLAGLMGYIDYLNMALGELDQAEVYRIINRLSRSANRLHRLIENYLFYAQTEIIRHDLQLLQKVYQYARCTNTADLIENKANKRLLVHKRPNDVEFDLVNLEVAVMPDHLEKLVEELVDNAIKFSNAESSIRVTSFEQEANFVVEIYNLGKGMTAHQIQSIDVNRQFDRDRYEQQGSGLGLVIVQNIVDIYRGRLIIESDGENFTQVQVRFPFQQPVE